MNVASLTVNPVLYIFYHNFFLKSRLTGSSIGKASGRGSRGQVPLDGNYQEMLEDREACWRSLRPPLSWADVPDKHPHLLEVLPQTEVKRGRKTEEPSSSVT